MWYVVQVLGGQEKAAQPAVVRRLDVPHMARHRYHAAARPQHMLVPGEMKTARPGCAEKVENLLLHAVS